ncbi:MAG: glutathione S-transferase family protein, partial [Proteobacteria bacterium]|nr:glutathione S-transferase family protein [Pseudomonadota bacterium]
EEELVWASQKDEHLARTPIGKIPFIEVGGKQLAESQVIGEYIEDVYPEKPLLPEDPMARAKVRELIEFIELHLELVARRLYREAFFGGTLSDETKKEVERDLTKGVKAFKRLAKFSPYVAGAEFTLADCAAAQHLPLVSMATKRIYGRDFFEDFPQVGAYLKEMNARPSMVKVAEDRKANAKAMAETTAKK